MEKNLVPTGTDSSWVIKLGAHNTNTLRRTSERSKYRVSDQAGRMMRQKDFTTSLQEKFATIVILPVGGLGFEYGAEYQHICVRAVELGLHLCPAEAGPLFRRAYTSQSQGGIVRIAMTPITVPSVGDCIFVLGHDSTGLVLGGEEVYPDDFFNEIKVFAFVRPLLFKGSPLR